jgi:hypothetical protein
MIIIIALACVGCESSEDSYKQMEIAVEPTFLFSYKFDTEYKQSGIILTNYAGMKNSVKIPDTIDGLPIVGIEATCFPVGQVTEVYFPDTVKYFKWGKRKSIDAKNLKTIIIPNGVTEIAPDTFMNFKSLTNIIIPETVNIIGERAFVWCQALTNITIPNSVTTINYGTFAHCISLTSVTLPESITVIDYGAFTHCASLISITIPDSVKKIGRDIFSDCGSLIDITYKGIIYSYDNDLPTEFYNAVK